MSSKNNRTNNRQLHTRVKTAKRRKTSSTRWLERQLNDPYVVQAKADGYRSRAAYKLLEINDKFDFLKPGRIVVDLGAAPGSWSQVAVAHGCKVIGIDLQEIEPISGAEFIKGDFLEEEPYLQLKNVINSYNRDKTGTDIVLSDMAASSCGHQQTDHIRIMALLEAAVELALEVLNPDGCFVGKVLQGGAEKSLMDRLNRNFTKVKHIKPAASRKDSSEIYVIAVGFRK